MPDVRTASTTVSSRPRAWSSYSNIRAKDVQGLKTMNSTEEVSKYKETVADSYYSPTLSRRLLGYGYDFPEKSPKKEKKWSIGSLFRRKKKEDSDSSSEEDFQKKGFLGRRRRKSEKKRKSKPAGTFDHVVIPRNLHPNGYKRREEDGILSDPSGGFSNYIGRALPKTPNQTEETATKIPGKNTRESLDDLDNSKVSLGSGSADSLSKKSRKDLAKVRAEARRLNMKNGSSSDEDSQRSASSSRFRSDESLGTAPPRDGSMSRRSRAARTERYLRRHSKDGENPKDHLRLSKSDVENSALNWKLSDESRSLSRSPVVPAMLKPKTSYSSLSSQSPSISGLSTIPPSHGSHNRVRVSNSTSNPSYKPPLSMNEYNHSLKNLPYDNNLNSQRSVSCDANMHKAAVTETEPEIIHVQLQIGRPNHRQRNLSLVNANHASSAFERQPPPPPPRDPKRLVTAQYYDSGRPNTYYFDNTGQRSKSFNVQAKQPPQTRKTGSFNLHPSYRSTSEDHLPNSSLPVQLIPRPSSTTPDTSLSQRLARKNLEQKQTQDYNYLTDKKPRSRKPIFIQTTKSAAQPASNNPAADKTETQKALDFWRRKDQEGLNYFQDKGKTRRSPQMFTSQTHVQTQIFLPSVLQNDINSDNLAESADDLVGLNGNVRPPSPFKPIDSRNGGGYDQETKIFAVNGNLDDAEDQDEDIKRKSTNLEEALDELEAIYNSLRLGDEDLLERAEQRERDAQAQKVLESKRGAYSGWGSSRGTLSDSSFSYEPFDSVDSPRRKRLSRKSQTVDRRADDMAYRKLRKDRSSTINDPQSFVSRISYLESSPFYKKEAPSSVQPQNKKDKEPDVTLDDVVYRNVKFANSNPKVVELQPPFGIPLGPITLAANSDYLHAVPEDISRPLFKPRKIPDLVKDDLAFRNLRKDSSKEAALPPVSPDDLKNNNSSCEPTKLDLNSLKKKRAVRSLSANIGSLISKDVLARGFEKHGHNGNADNEFKTLTDIADAMEIARQVLREKERKIHDTRKAFLSDTDTNNFENGNGKNFDKLTENRMNFLNSLKAPFLRDDGLQSDSYHLHAKPPRGLTPERRSPRSTKESTPIPVSPFDEKSVRLEHSSFDDLLTALATEARETSERITKELREFDEDKNKKTASSFEEVLNKADLSKRLSDIDAVSEQARLCERLLEGVVDSSDFVKKSEAPAEEVEQIRLEPEIVESVANIVLTRDDAKVAPKLLDKVAPDSDHDYENLLSDRELGLDEKCTSPFEEHKAELIASFQELKNVNLETKPDEVDSAEVKAKDGDSQPDGSAKESSAVNDEVAGEECVGVLESSFSVPVECACAKPSSFNNPNRQSCNFNVVVNNLPGDLARSESSSGFHSGNEPSSPSPSSIGGATALDSLESLKSPKMVLETSKLTNSESRRQILENQSMICRGSNRPGTSSVSAQDFRSREPDGRVVEGKLSPDWYRDPATVAVACSYGLACAHQLASLDFVAILGVLFAVLSFIAALLF